MYCNACTGAVRGVSGTFDFLDDFASSSIGEAVFKIGGSAAAAAIGSALAPSGSGQTAASQQSNINALLAAQTLANQQAAAQQKAAEKPDYTPYLIAGGVALAVVLVATRK